jgi:DNA sulfur modification protein DndD
MKLKRIKLSNFRQFHGEQEIEIADDAHKNVTLIHAQNGVGKTTILNALLWTFYAKTTEKFLEPERIINRAARQEGVKKASASIEFSHDGRDYFAQRYYTQDAGQDFKVHIIEDGNYTRHLTPDEFVESVMPKAMAPYYYFDGEHAETFSAAHHHKQVAKAIRNILGCNIAEIAIGDLEACAKALRREISSIPDASDLRDAERDLEHLELLSQQLEKKIQVLEERHTTIQETVDEIGRHLQGLTIVAAKQKLREEKERSLKGVCADISECQKAIIAWAGRPETIRLVAKKLTDSSLDFIDEETLRGKIPSPYNETFVKGLLQAHICVCERPLEEHTKEYQAVFKLLESAGNSQILNRIIKAKAKCQELAKDREAAVRLLRKDEERLGQLRQRQQELEQEIAAVGKEIAGIDISEVQDKENARRMAQTELRSIDTDIGATRHQKRQVDTDLQQAKRKYQQLSGENYRAKPLKLRHTLAEAATHYLRAELKEHEDSARKLIQSEVRKIIKATARKDYHFKLYDDYRMELLFEDGTMVPRSTGESQLLSLAFIAALVRFSKLRSNAKGGRILIPGIVAPLVLDSPFGQLDDIYRAATAAFVPELAEQVVVLVSRSQGDDSVLDALRPHVGAEYVLTGETIGERGDRKEEYIQINGRTYPLSRYECEREMTRIHQVQR